MAGVGTGAGAATGGNGTGGRLGGAAVERLWRRRASNASGFHSLAILLLIRIFTSVCTDNELGILRLAASATFNFTLDLPSKTVGWFASLGRSKTRRGSSASNTNRAWISQRAMVKRPSPGEEEGEADGLPCLLHVGLHGRWVHFDHGHQHQHESESERGFKLDLDDGVYTNRPTLSFSTSTRRRTRAEAPLELDILPATSTTTTLAPGSFYDAWFIGLGRLRLRVLFSADFCFGADCRLLVPAVLILAANGRIGGEGDGGNEWGGDGDGERRQPGIKLGWDKKDAHGKDVSQFGVNAERVRYLWDGEQSGMKRR
ncbi:hypothetical protein D9611_012384 [Ephemerocybe angulata]|uniref:Uncharacterized protein n=1 Tax=Ephemerocybe angulata TaxID=980116 RepID=A0A8H5CF68_9AGAR|nr:hypothetical protein D9611_012384 [Tulosesus angulatus]